MDRKKALDWAIVALKYYANAGLTAEEKNEIYKSILILTDKQEKKSLSRAVECPQCQSRNVFCTEDNYLCMRCNNTFSKNDL